MKRTRITPKPQPDNPYSTFGPRRTRLRPVSKKTAKAKRETDPARAAFVAERKFCDCCVHVLGKNRLATDCPRSLGVRTGAKRSSIDRRG